MRAFIADYANFLAQKNFLIAGSAVFLYDTILTTGEEVRCFWGRKVTGAAILFWLNKYMTMLYLVWNLGNLLDLPNNSCTLSVKGAAVVHNTFFLILASFSAIRVYALQRNIFLSFITFVLSMTPFGVNLVQFGFGLSGKNIPPFGCAPVGYESSGLDKKLTVLSRSCLIAADCLAAGVTWFTLARPRDIHFIGVLKSSLTRVLLIDGTVYFLTLGLVNSLHLTFALLALDVITLKGTSILENFTIPLTAVLVSRFLLHLQSASLRTVGSIHSSQMSTMNLDRSALYERVVGSLGTRITADDFGEEEGDFDTTSGNIDSPDQADEATEVQRD
ncbi:hypothetical protein BD310DRAFT_934758 [Dichomitus squalens]|uniref:DUF6533 domain-containing protein n=1 Tax=Dichomitus squalens TaxID=114155 RepID=A0A4Q9PLA8_9APHY|nr:hypothetical protein BD310DRAFT_934758 [Dichomitus squalens]